MKWAQQYNTHNIIWVDKCAVNLRVGGGFELMAIYDIIISDANRHSVEW